MEDVLADCSDALWEGCSVLRLPNELLMLAICLEQVNIDFRPFRRVVDLAWLSEKCGESLDPVFLIRWARAYGLQPVVGYCLSAALALYGHLEKTAGLLDKLQALDSSVKRRIGKGEALVGAVAPRVERGGFALGHLFRGNLRMFRLIDKPLATKARVVFQRFSYHVFHGRGLRHMASRERASHAR